MLDEHQFRTLSDDALATLERALQRASEQHEFDVDRNQGALTIEFEDPPAKFVVSPNAPVRQIWISARVQSFKLDWDPAQSTFVLPAGHRTLHQLLGDLIGEQLGEPVQLR